MSEHLSQVAIFHWARLNEHRCSALAWMFAVPNGGHRNKVVAGKLKAEGVKRGVPDICLPAARNGFHGLWIEMKYGKNKPTDIQLEFHEFLREAGHRVEICWTAEEARKELCDYLQI